MLNSFDSTTRRDFLRYTMLSSLALPTLSGIFAPNSAQAAIADGVIFVFPEDMSTLTDEQRMHFPRVTLPPVVEDGSQAPIVVKMDHPMDDDNYIKSIQIVNFDDPVIVKGEFFMTPANGDAYIGTQIRLASGESTVWVIAECNKHGKYAVSKTVKVAAGGC